MGNRLTRIYTRTGDDGSTGLADGRRVPKDDARVRSMGAVDELNCAIGVLLAHTLPEAIGKPLSNVQHRLFDLGAELSIPGSERIQARDVDDLERIMDELNGDLPPLKEFILPGGSPAVAACHMARAVCRRAERELVTLRREQAASVPAGLRFVNRLSDLLFVAARVIARSEGGTEVYWLPMQQT